MLSKGIKEALGGEVVVFYIPHSCLDRNVPDYFFIWEIIFFFLTPIHRQLVIVGNHSLIYCVSCLQPLIIM